MSRTKRDTPQQPAEPAPPAQDPVVANAYRKLLQRQELTRAEQLAVRRYEKEKEERQRWKYYRSIPQKHWRQMSGRQTKVLNEQAARYGIPFGGASIDLPGVVRAFHDFLAANALKLARDDDVMLQGNGASPALERYREERALIARLDRLEREGALSPRDQVREWLARIAARLRAAGDTLQRQFGPGAAEIMHEALDDIEQEVRRVCGPAADGSADNGHAGGTPADDSPVPDGLDDAVLPNYGCTDDGVLDPGPKEDSADASGPG